MFYGVVIGQPANICSMRFVVVGHINIPVLNARNELVECLRVYRSVNKQIMFVEKKC
jgi:hypothetical protein